MVYIKAKSDGLSLYEHTQAVLETALFINKQAKYNLDTRVLKYSAIFHDLGKANPQFQKNMETGNFDVICRHEISSLFFINAVPEDIRKQVALIILSHHKSFNKDEKRSFSDLNENYNPSLFQEPHINNIEKWGLLVKSFLKEYYGIDCSVPTVNECNDILDTYWFKIVKKNNEYGYSQYRGLFMMADHFASAYPHKEVREAMINNFFISPNVDIYNGKNVKYPLSLIDIDKTKRHTFVTAPCGAGKTNIMMKSCTKRIFYCLPFQASINAMFKRLKNDLGDGYEYAIKHSSMASLMFIDEHIKTVSNFFGSSVKVMTPFQIMPILLCMKGYESLIMDIKGQDVIFDEIHTYSEGLTQTAILNLIETLVYLDCNIHICSATIPSTLKNKIIEILGEDNTQVISLSKEEINSFNRHIIHTCNEFDFDEIKKRYERGEKVLIVRNQKQLSVETFLSLKEKIPNAKILLLHSGFRRKDRNILESKLMEFNKSSEPCILVSTQVVEVSLDINFDCIFTDCADIMNLIQRFGRVNRQRTNIGILKDVYIIKTNKDTCKPYDEDICNKTFEILSSINDETLYENEIQNYIDYVHPHIIEDSKSLLPITDGKWNTRMYWNTVNDSVYKSLQFDGDIGICEDDVDMYMETLSQDLEIPIRITRGKLFGKISLKPIEKKGCVIAYVIPSEFYDEKLGIHKKN